MKKTLLAVSTLIFATTLSLTIQAADTTTPAPATPSMPMKDSAMQGDDHPCKPIAEACKSAGYVRGGKSTGKGIFENCMKPIMSGQTVTGVTVNPSDVQACKTKFKEHHGHHGHEGQGKPAEQS